MPYLMLDFKSEHAGNKGKFHFTIIDTDKGNVIEVQGDASEIYQEERQPNWNEMHTVDQVLNNGPSQKIQQTQFDQLKAERDSYRQKALSADETIRKRNQEIIDLRIALDNLKDRDFNDDARNLLASALEIHIEELALIQKFESYELAKKIFKQLTGKDWVNEDDS